MAKRTRPVPSLRRLSPSTSVDSAGGTRTRLNVATTAAGSGRGDHRTDDECQVEAEAGRGVQHDRDDRRRDHHPGNGEERKTAEPASQLGRSDPVGGFEHEPGEEHEKHDVGRDHERRDPEAGGGEHRR
jgi:hypothetical protein